jgi:hypothetical protein
MCDDGLRRLNDPPSVSNLLLGPVCVALAQRVNGIIGFVVTPFRPDGFFAFLAISQGIAQHLTAEVWRHLLDLGEN